MQNWKVPLTSSLSLRLLAEMFLLLLYLGNNWHLIMIYVSSVYMFSYWFRDVLAFPYLTHWIHLLTNCTTNPEGYVASFASKMYNFFSIWGNISCILFSPKDVAGSYKLGSTIHLFIWVISICFNYKISARASSLFVLKLS